MYNRFLIAGAVHDGTEFAGEDLRDQTLLKFVLNEETQRWFRWQSGKGEIRYGAKDVSSIAFANLKPIFGFLIAVQLQISGHSGEI